MSETKKVISMEYAKSWKNKEGGEMHNFKVKFEGDERTYAYTSNKKDDPPYFKPGEEAEFTIEEQKYEKDGTTTIYYNVKPVKKPFAKGGFMGKEKTKREALAESLSFTSSYVKDLVVAGKVELSNYLLQFDILQGYNEKKINEYYSE